ncbi:uncharacterized protein [Cicer arietinum]|uniref:Uncharacterized protein LOC101488279 n=1 Tax=Cicer arietinum TaxID=3827 RepID=A0A3Q7YB85_CICAR|nr:uncharacterized protein LOC101488279 [Cicer arietinum]
MVDLYKQGIKPNYWCWDSHGEEAMSSNNRNTNNMNKEDTSSQSLYIEPQRNPYEYMIFDAIGSEIMGQFEQPIEEPPKFFMICYNLHKDHWDGCDTHSELSMVVRMLSIKAERHILQQSFDEILQVMNEGMPNDNLLIPNFYRAKKLVSKLGMESKGGKDVRLKRTHYLPLTPRLKRLYASMNSAHHMRWPYEHQQVQGVLEHPSDAEAWKHFDLTHPNFSSEPHNVRLGLCADGFAPFGHLVLNIRVGLPHKPKSKIDVYLQPLIDELKLLWEEGWMTAGKLACPYCMERTKAFHLRHGAKTSWFDCHRQFLPNDHLFRRNKDAFYKNRIEKLEPPPRLIGQEIWQRVHMNPMIIDNDEIQILTKLSIFWDLPYWSTNLIRHNLDVMHIEKNVPDYVFNIVMDIKGKTKDNIKARMDLKEYCKRKDLEIHEQSNGRIIKPKANYTFSLEKKEQFVNG